MAVTALPADPHARLTTLLRARQVSCRGGLTDLADAVLTITQPPPQPAGRPDREDEATAWQRERASLLLDRDTLACALEDLAKAASRHLHARTAATTAQLDQAVGDALDALVPLPAG